MLHKLADFHKFKTENNNRINNAVVDFKKAFVYKSICLK
jgi:hypothetical protein